MNTDGWNHLTYQGTDIRWRHDGREHANESSGYEIQTRDTRTGEWRAVRNYNSRDWFVVGVIARRKLVAEAVEDAAS